MKKYNISCKHCVVLWGCLLLLSACGEGFLDKLNDDSLVVPQTLDDLEALLENNVVMNGTIQSSGCPLPALGEASSDDFYFDEKTYSSRSQPIRDMYIWQPYYTYDGFALRNWFFPYRSIMYANVVLDQLDKIDRTEENSLQWERIKGSALFFRANVYYHLAQVFAYPYSSDTENVRSLPVRLEADVSADPAVPTLKQYYQMLINDLNNAMPLLKDTEEIKTRPSKVTSYALLSRIYLVMHDFQQAQYHAEQALYYHDSLLDYNTLSEETSYPIPLLNTEVLFHINMNLNNVQNIQIVSDHLINLYEVGDLRRDLFFTEEGFFRGSYAGDDILFGGFTTSELYLIIAECLARDNKGSEALFLLDHLRKHRFQPESFTESVYQDSKTTLTLVLEERRRELVLRGSTWSDLRRLNLYEDSKRTLTRVIDGKTYVLPPGDPRYTLLIPEETISAVGMTQNRR